MRFSSASLPLPTSPQPSSMLSASLIVILLLLCSVPVFAADPQATDSQTIRTFVPKNVPIKDAMTVLRSILGLKNVAARESPDQIIVRDTEAKIEIAARLMEILDKPRSEVMVSVEFFYLNAAARKAIGEIPAHPSGKLMTTLRANAEKLAAPTLSMFDGGEAAVRLMDRLTLSGADGEIQVEVGFDLEMESQVHPRSRAVTLAVQMNARDSRQIEGGRLVTSSGEVVSSLRLEDGQTVVLRGFETGNALRQGSLLASSYGFEADGGSGLVMALTPRIVRVPTWSAAELAAICVGAADQLALCSP